MFGDELADLSEDENENQSENNEEEEQQTASQSRHLIVSHFFFINYF